MSTMESIVAQQVYGGIIHNTDYAFRQNPTEFLVSKKQEIREIFHETGFDPRPTLDEKQKTISIKFANLPGQAVQLSEGITGFAIQNHYPLAANGAEKIAQLLDVTGRIFLCRDLGPYEAIGIRFDIIFQDKAEKANFRIRRGISPAFLQATEELSPGLTLKGTEYVWHHYDGVDSPKVKLAVQLRTDQTDNAIQLIVDYKTSPQKKSYSFLDHYRAYIELF